MQKSVEEKKNLYNQKNEELSVLRQKIATQNSDIVEYSAKQRRLNSCIDKLSSLSMLLKEKSNSIKDKYESLSSDITDSKSISPTKQKIIDEIKTIEEKLNVFNNELSELKGLVETARLASLDAEQKLQLAQTNYDQQNGEFKTHQQESLDYRKKINDASDDIVSAQAKIATLDAQIKSLEDKLLASHEEEVKAKKVKEEKTKIQTKLNKEFEKNQSDIEKFIEKKDKINNEIVTLTDQLNDVNANIIAIEKILQTTYEESSDAAKWLNENKNKFSKIENLSDAIDVDDQYLNLVETILGSYSSSFISSETDVLDIRKSLDSEDNANGSIRLVTDEVNDYSQKMYKLAKEVASKSHAIALCDKVKVKDNSMLGILSNVVVFDSFDEAIKHFDKNNGLCFASLDGSIVYPDGRYLIGSPFYMEGAFDNDSSRTILSYKKNLKKLNKVLSQTNKKLENEKDNLSATNDKLSDLYEDEKRLKNDLITVNAELDYANKHYDELSSSYVADKELLDKSKKERNMLKESYSATAPDMERFKKSLNDLLDLIKKEEDNLDVLQKDLSDARALNEQKKQEYNTLTVKEAALSERVKSQTDVLDNAKERLREFENRQLQNVEEVKVGKKLYASYCHLSDALSKLHLLAKKDLENLDAQFSSVNSEVEDIQKQSDAAINAANEARKSFDDENVKLNDIQIELGRLEVQVQNAVDVIDNIDGISVDKALEMPDIENREEKEEQSFKIRRRIANMGTINPDAKEEYETLKERFDFLNEQVEDLRSAKTSLLKIDKIIEQRMKDDFVNTFEEVNANFQEIFSILFPGGRAKLELEDPNDIENSGVEVKAQPHGKLISKMSLMSGGEKSLVALCLLFAVYKKRSTPFYILDEVEAALDDTNLRRLIKYLEDLRDNTQLIMITHQRRTMEMADVLYGVSMKNDGVTRVVSQRLDKDNKLHDIDK